MEALDLSEAAESSETSGPVKSEDGSPTHSTGRGSPPPNCAICLGRCRNKSFTDSCLHQFCFKCLLTWSRVKTECPLCKQNFKSIIHNVKSNHQYEEYPVQQPQSEERAPNPDPYNDIVNASRFRYRTTLTLPRRDTNAIRQLLMHYPPLLVPNAPRVRDPRLPAEFRRTVYRHNLWARPLPDFTGRFRDCSPEFFRYNDTQVHRLVPWLCRELYYLLNNNSGHVTYVMARVLELLPQHPILSEEFRNALRRFLGERTEHFLHEFHCYASTPYDLAGYDRHVQYGSEPRVPLVSQVLSSSDSDSRDSDIVMVTSSRAATPPPAPAPAPPTHPTVIPIETISHSDSGSDSEVMLVGYVKPPHQRTPELVDLLASDSDVVVAEDEPVPAPAPAPAPASASLPAQRSMVRFKLSMRREPSLASRGSPSQPRGRRGPPSDSSYTPSGTPPLSSEPDGGTPPVSSDREGDLSTDTDSNTDCSDARRRQRRRRKSRRRAGGAKTDTQPARRRKTDKKDESVRGSARTKGKSKNGKDVKSSAPDLHRIPLPSSSLGRPEFGDAELPQTTNGAIKREETKPTVEQHEPAASPLRGVLKRPLSDSSPPCQHEKRRRSSSGSCSRSLDRPGPSGLARRKHRKRSARESCDKRRLRSVVQVMQRLQQQGQGSAGRQRRAYSSSSSDDELPLRRAGRAAHPPLLNHSDSSCDRH